MKKKVIDLLFFIFFNQNTLCNAVIHHSPVDVVKKRSFTFHNFVVKILNFYFHYGYVIGAYGTQKPSDTREKYCDIAHGLHHDKNIIESRRWQYIP